MAKLEQRKMRPKGIKLLIGSDDGVFIVEEIERKWKRTRKVRPFFTSTRQQSVTPESRGLSQDSAGELIRANSFKCLFEFE